MKSFLNWWRVKSNRFVFFIAALLVHFIAALIIAGLIIFPPKPAEQNDFQKAYVQAAAAPPPPPPNTSPPTPTVKITTPVTATPILSQGAAPAFEVKMPDLTSPLTTTMTSAQPAHIAPPTQVGISASRLSTIRTTEGKWGRDAGNIRESGGDVHNLQAKNFPVFLAQYADGDWSCNNFFNQGPGTVTSGALPNFLAKVKEWSHGSLTALPPRSISISSPDLISTPPPFIFFTGHRDFHLTPEEVVNLQAYLQAGGAIWGDSAFAGYGSRFDVAFKREMKRVLPDADKNFEPVLMSHPIFSKGWFPNMPLPPGMNYRADPMEMITLDGKIAIVYTPDDYSDMMTMALEPGSDSDSAQYIQPHPYKADAPLSSPEWFIDGSRYYYRNYRPPAVMEVDKMSMNILTHLLIRFDDQLQFAP